MHHKIRDGKRFSAPRIGYVRLMHVPTVKHRHALRADDLAPSVGSNEDRRIFVNADT